MTLTTQQSYNALLNYPRALQKTRLFYLHLLENSSVSEEDKDQIWAVSLVLQCMIDNHEKYQDLLVSLNKDEQAQAIIKNLFDQITIDPATNLQGFVDQVQTVMQSEKFKSELTKFDHQIRKNSRVGLYGFLGGLSMFLLFLSCTALVPFVGLWAMCAVVPLFIAAGVFFTIAGSNNQQEKIKTDPISRYSLQSEKQPAYSLTEEYCYKKGNTESGSITTKISKTHLPQLRRELRQSFFQPQMNHTQTLNQEVQVQFSQLATHNC